MSISKYKPARTLHQDPKTQQYYTIDIFTQATRVINAFGGPTKFRKCLADCGFKISNVQIHRWNHPREKGGCAGIIPAFNHQPIMEAAHYHGIPFSFDLFDPRPTRIRTNVYAKRANRRSGGRKVAPRVVEPNIYNYQPKWVERLKTDPKMAAKYSDHASALAEVDPEDPKTSELPEDFL